MPTNITKETKPSGSITKETKPSNSILTYPTWDDSTQTWNDANNTWDDSDGSGSFLTKETKP